MTPFLAGLEPDRLFVGVGEDDVFAFNLDLDIGIVDLHTQHAMRRLEVEDNHGQDSNNAHEPRAAGDEQHVGRLSNNRRLGFRWRFGRGFISSRCGARYG